jgi:20S proteasome subunit alpha 7
MTAIGTGYDLSVGTFSPEGRIFQVEYAGKAVDNSGTTLGLVTPHGVLLAVEKPLHSKLLKRTVNRRIETIDLHVGIASCGFGPDVLAMAKRAREEAAGHRETFLEEERIPVRVLAERLGLFVHAYTLYSSVRPFGISSLVAGVDATGAKLFLIEPDGTHYVSNLLILIMCRAIKR